MNDILLSNSNKFDLQSLLKAGQESLSLQTQKAYERDLFHFLQIVNKDIPEVTPNDIILYNNTLEDKGYKNSTINRKMYSISKIFNLYQLAGVIDKNPIVELNKLKKISRPVNRQINNQVEIEDIQAVIKAGGKTALIINTLANTGLRISELINIKDKDIEDYKVNSKKFKNIRIVGKGKKERFIFLSMGLFKEIKKMFNENSEHLFHSSTGKELHRVNLYKQIKQTFKTYTEKDIHPHNLRHFFATYKIDIEKQDPKSVSKYLGHSGTAITLDMYVDTALNAENSMILHK